MIKYLITLASFIFIPVIAFAGTYYFDPTEVGTLTPPACDGTTYHVAKTGNDTTGNGSEGTPWLTLAKAFDQYTNRGSANGVRILIHAGTYYERANIPNDAQWTRGASYQTGVVVSAAGDGEVIIDASPTWDLGAWSVYSGSIYQSTFQTLTPGGIEAVVIDDDFYSYHPKASVGALAAEGDWFYDSATYTIYVYALSAKGDPSDDDVITVIGPTPNDDSCMGFRDGSNSYVTLYDLTFRGAQGNGVYTYQNGQPDCNNVKIEKCQAKFNSKAGLSLSDVDYGEITKNYIYGNVLNNWPRGKWNSVCANIDAGGWPSAAGGSTSNNVTFSGNIITDNGGEGTLMYKGSGGHTWEDNLVGNNWSVGIYCDNNPNPIIRRNVSFATRTFTSADVSSTCAAGAETNRVLRRCRQEGIITADEDYGTGANYEGGQIYNNLIYNCRRGFGHYGEATGTGLINTTIYSNTILLPNVDPADISDSFAAFQYRYNSGNNTGSLIRNNIVLGQAGGYGYIVDWLHSGDPNDSGIAWDYNVYYHPNASTPYRFKDTNYNFTDWKTQSSQDANASVADPALGDIAWSSARGPEILTLTSIDVTDYAPTATTQTGYSLGAPYNADFDTTSRTSYTSGIFEYGAGAPDVTAPTVTSATVNGDTVTVNFDETVVTTGYDAADFNLDCTTAGTDIALTSPSGSGSSRTFTAATPVAYGDTCNLDYVGSTDDIEDQSGNDLATFSNTAVTNNTAAAQTHNGCMTVGGYRFAVGGKMLLVQ